MERMQKPGTVYSLLILMVAYTLCTMYHAQAYAQGDYFTSKGDMRADTLIFSGEKNDYPATPLEGELFYNANPSIRAPRYFNGTQWVGFAPGSGGGAKYVASKIVAASDTVNATMRADYVCDGTNDQVEIQSALDSLGSKGGAVYLLEGTYNINNNIIFRGAGDSNQALIGTGKNTILKLDNSSSAIWLIDALGFSSPNQLRGLLISQLRIDGSDIVSGNSGIHFNSVLDSVIDKVWIDDWGSAGISLNDSHNITISNCVLNSNLDGIFAANSSSHNRIVNNQITNSEWIGINISGAGGHYIVAGNHVSGSATHGISIESASSYNIVRANQVKDSGQQGIYNNNGSYNIISGNHILNNNRNGIFMDLNASYNVISANTVHGNAYNGISLYGNVGNNDLTSNIVSDNGSTAGYSGISVLISAGNNLIASNSISDTAGSGYGIDIGNGANGNYLTANLISGAGYTGRLIRDLGSATRFTDKAKFTLEQRVSASATLDVATLPRSYVALNPAANITLTLSAGKLPGDILILENISTRIITVNDGGGVNLQATRALGQYDILKLIWNGTNWLEMSFANNQP